MSKFTKTEKLVIVIFGVISAITGLYGAWLEVIGEYEKMGLLFFVWLILQMPVYIFALLTAFLFNILGAHLYFYLLTFIWWTLLGSFLGFVLVFFKNYFDDICLD